MAQLGRYTEAIECFDKVLEADPQKLSSLINKGHTLGRIGLLQDARECYLLASELASKGPPNTFSFCESMFGLRRWDAALVALRKALKRYPRGLSIDFTDMLLSLSQAHAHLRPTLESLIAIASEADRLADLGDALVRSLRLIDPSRLDDNTLESCRHVARVGSRSRRAGDFTEDLPRRNRIPHSGR